MQSFENAPKHGDHIILVIFTTKCDNSKCLVIMKQQGPSTSMFMSLIQWEYSNENKKFCQVYMYIDWVVGLEMKMYTLHGHFENLFKRVQKK